MEDLMNKIVLILVLIMLVLLVVALSIFIVGKIRDYLEDREIDKFFNDIFR